MEIKRLPAFSTNYIFLLHDPQTNQAAVVDPGESQSVIECLDKLEAKLVAIFNTHHHSDHIGGNKALIQKFPNLIVYGGSKDKGRIPGQQVYLKEGDQVEFAGNIAEIYFLPGHTFAHIAYYFSPNSSEEIGDLFCGDTLFAGGCGRLFEGTPSQMVQSLTKLRNLPDNTRVWCAHEYTLNNLQFALTVDPNNLDLQTRYHQVEKNRYLGKATVPSLLGEEKKTNPFLRWDQPILQAVLGINNPVRLFGKLRKMKDDF
ncbi:hydroxyacylglutathione hydrolase [Crocosphaera sp. UHCC 0190]|uniref:hydroxyacylglutathione hydrolase n=1 Tax=Crocosphaera sp. UHCC 0190 TaxID=3110246 RepID=UPI002B1EE693|nr:hydroxyacylglutathione hydrolase [Crocosphaera sp. UHCC 0190]MEA5509677.1 hydroxyacylglutathione hydrolase [Crocosphaera sp. UHCC 0190]